MEKQLVFVMSGQEVRLEDLDDYDSCNVVNLNGMRHVYMLGKVLKENIENIINYNEGIFTRYDFRGKTFEFVTLDESEGKDFCYKIIVTHKGFVFVEKYECGVLKACKYTNFALFEDFQSIYFERLYNRIILNNKYMTCAFYLDSLIYNFSKTGYNLDSIPDCTSALENEMFIQKVKRLIISTKGNDKLKDYLPEEYTWACRDKNRLVTLGTDSLFSYKEVDEETNMKVRSSSTESMNYMKRKMVGYRFLADDIILFTSEGLSFLYQTQVLFVRGYVFFLRGRVDLMFAWEKYVRQSENHVYVFDTGRMYEEVMVVAAEVPIEKCEYLQPYYLRDISVDEFISLTPYLSSGFMEEQLKLVSRVEDALGREIIVVNEGKMASARALGEINFPKLEGQVLISDNSTRDFYSSDEYMVDLDRYTGKDVEGIKKLVDWLSTY